MSKQYRIESSRFLYSDDTLYPTKKAALDEIRLYVKEEVRPQYKKVWRTYEGQVDRAGGHYGDGYAWVYWDDYKPARLWVEEEDASADD